MISPITYFLNTVAKKCSHFQIFVPIFCRVHLEPAKRVRNNCNLSSHFPFCTVYGFTGCKGFTKLCIYITSNSRYPKVATEALWQKKRRLAVLIVHSFQAVQSNVFYEFFQQHNGQNTLFCLIFFSFMEVKLSYKQKYARTNLSFQTHFHI